MEEYFIFPNFSFVFVIFGPPFHARAPWNCHAFHALSTALGVYVWIRYRSLVMEYGETCIPGRMDDSYSILTVADVKL
jgi:hypothetical protein